MCEEGKWGLVFDVWYLFISSGRFYIEREEGVMK